MQYFQPIVSCATESSRYFSHFACCM